MRNSPRYAVPDVASIVLRPDLANLYRAKACALIAAFKDESLRAEAFDSLRTLVKWACSHWSAMNLPSACAAERGAMLELCSCVGKQKTPSGLLRGGLANQIGCGSRI